MVRAVQRLHKFEYLESPIEKISEPEELQNKPQENRSISEERVGSTSEQKVPRVTKYGRTIKPVQRLTYAN